MSFKNDKDKFHTNVTPGPGNYNTISMNIKGKYPTSSFKNTKTIVFGLSKDSRFKNKSSNY